MTDRLLSRGALTSSKGHALDYLVLGVRAESSVKHGSTARSWMKGEKNGSSTKAEVEASEAMGTESQTAAPPRMARKLDLPDLSWFFTLRVKARENELTRC